MLICPKCRSKNITLDTGGYTGKYRCKKCNYIGALILEKYKIKKKKKKKKILLLILLIFIISCVKEECKTITLTPEKDTVIEAWQKDKVWGLGKSISIRCCDKKDWHSLLKFDLNKVKDKKIKSVILSLYKREQPKEWINNPPEEVKIYKILNDWNENISWNEFYKNNKIGEELGSKYIGIEEGWYNINIKLYNNLLIKTLTKEGYARFHSKEDINKPKLIINYCG